MSSILIVNGVSFPPPQRGFQIKVITTVDSGRNANGGVVAQVVGRNQYKLEAMRWPCLSGELWERMLGAVKPFFVPVRFENPETGGFTSITMYPGDRSGEPYWIDRGSKKVKMYRECSFNLIDCGW